MARPDGEVRRPFKRPAISDQQRRRELVLLRQAQNRRDAQQHARFLANSVVSLQNQSLPPVTQPDESVIQSEEHGGESGQLCPEYLTVIQASRLPPSEGRRWFSSQLMLPEWMIDIPYHLNRDWYVFPRPAGKRCFVISSNGTTVSRLRNGSILHHFPSVLPNGARRKDISGPAHMYCILDCIFHEPDETYYVIDMVFWRGYSLYDCTAEFRFFWLTSKLDETGACKPSSSYHKYRFSAVPIHACNQMGLQAAYTGSVPYVKDGLLFYNKHAHYQAGNTPLALVWKDVNCSQYVLDTDSKGQVPDQQQVVLELQDNGKLTTSDDPPICFGYLDREVLQKSALRPGTLLRFVSSSGGMKIVDGKLEISDMHYVGKANRARAFADSYSKIFFQYAARHSPLRIEDLMASIHSSQDNDNESMDVDMVK